MGIQRIEPQTGHLFDVPRGATLRVTDPCGQQVSDVYAACADDTSETLSSGRTLDNLSKYLLTSGDVLYGNRGTEMIRIGEDTVGRHDFLLTPCSQQTFDLLYPDHQGYHPSCMENLTKAFAPRGVTADQIGTTFNAFMNVVPTPEGLIDIQPGLSRAGDHVDFIALVDLLIVVTSCSAEICNNGVLTPIDVELIGA